ncbi:glycosyltransferase family 4 protein [Pendulispora rubella]|uniref:Glycosyltransferase family 4 protein n=1 Tax=Pendulispora rubella TaxID=2741070 RepID=A0ABZ2LBU8_9BACT
MSAGESWHIVTGEYPPAPGGVADYTQSVARALAEAGDDVHVWAPPARAPLARVPGITLHPLPDHFGPRSLVALSKGLSEARRHAAPSQRTRVLLQYVPQAFGFRGMNVPFCAVLASQRQDLWVMFHEVLFRRQRGENLRLGVLAAATRLMAAALVYRADRMFVSIPAWNDVLKAHVPGTKPATWLPVPSNISCMPAPERVAARRASMSQDGQWELVGHFGTYGEPIASLVERVFTELFARHATCKVVLMGRNGPSFAAAWSAKRPEVKDRLIATGELSGEDMATHLAACDLAVQPYPDGISSRRGSVMASLALGIPVVSNEGMLSESIWRTEQSVGLGALDGDGPFPPMVDLVCTLLNDRARASALGERGRGLYDRLFSLESTVRTLRGSS